MRDTERTQDIEVKKFYPTYRKYLQSVSDGNGLKLKCSCIPGLWFPNRENDFMYFLVSLQM